MGTQAILVYFLKEMLKADGMNNKLERNLGKSVSRGVAAAKQKRVILSIIGCSYRGETKDCIRL